MREYKVLVKRWLTREDNKNPIPMRTMVGTIVKQTNKAYLMRLHGRPEPSSKCLHCNKTLTHPVSVLYGVGPVCGKHMHINPLSSEEELQEKMDEIKAKLKAVTWEGWIPKSQIVEMTEIGVELDEVLEEASARYDVSFKYEGKIYRTQTNSDKLLEIRQNAEIIDLEQIS